MFSNRNKVVVQLTGGLGNQLFGLFFGIFISKYNKLPLILDETLVPYGLTNHGSTIKSFDIKYPIISKKFKNRKIKHFYNRVIDKLCLEISWFRKLYFRIFRIYKSNVIGFDPKTLNIKGGFLAIGYFQSWKYVTEAIELLQGRTLTLIKPSMWFESTSRKLQQLNPTIVHLRRGDLKNINNPSGLLSLEYYLSAISRLPECNLIWVFSDDIEDARRMFSGMSKYNIEFIQPPFDTDPAESMLIMSLGSQIIIANSTFSWWAAMFGMKSKTVIAPFPFFKNIDEPLDFIPITWLRHESKWED